MKPQRPEPTGWVKDRVTRRFPCASAVLGPGARTWPLEAPGPELAPSLSWVLSLPGSGLLSGLTVPCVRPFLLMEKPLWAVRRPHKQNTRTFYFSCSWVARKHYKSQLGLSQASHMPSAQSQNRHHPSPRKSQMLQSESWTPPRPHPQLCHSTRFWPCWSSGPGALSPARWPGLGSWEPGAEAGGCSSRPRATGRLGSPPCSVKRS